MKSLPACFALYQIKAHNKCGILKTYVNVKLGCWLINLLNVSITSFLLCKVLEDQCILMQNAFIIGYALVSLVLNGVLTFLLGWSYVVIRQNQLNPNMISVNKQLDHRYLSNGVPMIGVGIPLSKSLTKFTKSKVEVK